MFLVVFFLSHFIGGILVVDIAFLWLPTWSVRMRVINYCLKCLLMWVFIAYCLRALQIVTRAQRTAGFAKNFIKAIPRIGHIRQKFLNFDNTF